MSLPNDSVCKEQVFENVFKEHGSSLRNFIFYKCGDTALAEDMVQEAWIRWQSTSTEPQSPKAFLSKLITRLCIDYLRSARVKRERYVGTWLPEPLVQDSASRDHAELAESLSYAFLMLLECLSPTERAVFLLRDVFDYDYGEIAATVGKTVPNCRQILRRARQPAGKKVFKDPALLIDIYQCVHLV
ncbi:MAG: sigma-70 family RNA polymerase sigma factor, partial [Bacteroidota bacterium]